MIVETCGVFTLRAECRDFDAFTEAARRWNLEFRQLDCGHFDGEMEQVIAGPVSVARCRFNRRIEQVGTAPVGIVASRSASSMPRVCSFSGT